MLFRYTENPPENRLFGPGFLRLSGLRLGYTENSSFPYRRPFRQSAKFKARRLGRPVGGGGRGLYPNGRRGGASLYLYRHRHRHRLY